MNIDQIAPKIWDEFSLVWMKKTGRDLKALDCDYIIAWLDGGISPQAIIEGMKKSLNAWKPKFPGDRVRLVAYCQSEVYSASRRETEQRR